MLDLRLYNQRQREAGLQELPPPFAPQQHQQRRRQREQQQRPQGQKQWQQQQQQWQQQQQQQQQQQEQQQEQLCAHAPTGWRRVRSAPAPAARAR